MPPPILDRRLGPTEAIYHLLDELYCLNFVVFAEINGPLALADLNRALHTIQHEQPLLRTRIVLTQGHPRFKPVSMDKSPLNAQLGALRNWRLRVTEQLSAPFDSEAPLARFFWFTGSGGKSVAAMVFHHAIADGKSGTHLLLKVLRRAGGEDLPLTVQAAHPCAQDLDPIKHKGLVKSSVQKFGFWWGQGKAVLMRPRQLPGYDMQLRGQRSIRAVAYALPKETGQALQSACRAHGTTVHGALGAAQVLAINHEFETPAARHLALTSLADLRGVLNGKLTSDDLGLYVATITTVHAVAEQPDFWQLAQSIKTQLTQVLSSGDANLIHSVYPQQSLLPTTRHSAHWVQSAAALAPASSMLTNIGKLEPITLHTGARVRSVAFMVSPPPQQPICVTVATYADCMYLHVLYDQTKLDDKQAKRIGDALIRFIEAAI